MGMAASQARCLALMGRKTNVEWQGQQINQARTALANESASLFNQMLTMSVPDCPDTTDFTRVQYSYSDGLNESTIENYYQLSSADPDYNYIVTHHYYTDVYQGSMKKLNDPQVQFKATEAVLNPLIEARNTAKDEFIDASNHLDNLYSNLRAVVNAETNKYQNKNLTATAAGDTLTYNDGTDVYNATISGTAYTFNAVAATDDPELIALLESGAFASSGYTSVDDLDKLKENGVYKEAGGGYLLKESLEAVRADLASGITGDALSIIGGTSINTNIENSASIYDTYKKGDYTTKEAALNTASASILNQLTYIGNCELTQIDLTGPYADAITAELNQVVKDLEAEGVNSSLCDAWSAETSNYKDGYDGTVYSFTMNNVTYYTTLDDILESYTSGSGNNNIDGQNKLSYYSASYVSTKISKTEKALLETDGNGRFTSVRFEDDTVTYNLKTETITDSEAYDDAMNQYYYDVQVYEKTIADINARTEIIQAEDRTLELRLKQLDTEETALSNEIEAVKKVVSKSLESGFKTFAE